jgi:hypothetical protein
MISAGLSDPTVVTDTGADGGSVCRLISQNRPQQHPTRNLLWLVSQKTHADTRRAYFQVALQVSRYAQTGAVLHNSLSGCGRLLCPCAPVFGLLTRKVQEMSLNVLNHVRSWLHC